MANRYLCLLQLLSIQLYTVNPAIYFFFSFFFLSVLAWVYVLVFLHPSFLFTFVVLALCKHVKFPCKVVDLKKELKTRGLSTIGTKNASHRGNFFLTY